MNEYVSKYRDSEKILEEIEILADEFVESLPKEMPDCPDSHSLCEDIDDLGVKVNGLITIVQLRINEDLEDEE